MGIETFMNLEAFVYQPHEHNYATTKWLTIIDLPEGPEIAHDQEAAHFTIEANGFAQLMRRTQLFPALMNFNGTLTLMIRTPNAATQIGTIDFHTIEPEIKLYASQLKEYFGISVDEFVEMEIANIHLDVERVYRDQGTPEPAARPGPRSDGRPGHVYGVGDTDPEGKCSCCGDEPCHDPSDPPMTAREANDEARRIRLRERNRQEQEEFKNTDVSINSYNSDPESYTYATFEQSAATLNLMADWLEERDGLTTHLAASITRSLHAEMSDPGSTYRQVNEVGHRPKDDVAVIQVEDSENEMDLIIEVRKFSRT